MFNTRIDVLMARGLSIDKLLYLFFHCPFQVQTCFVTANATFAFLPFDIANSSASPPSTASPVNVMHTVRSLLFACLGFFLLGSESNASALSPRQHLNTSSVYSTRFPNVTWDNNLWRVTTTALDQGHYQSRQSVANGYIGGCFDFTVNQESCELEALMMFQALVLQPWGLSSK